jgi:hypothetical protein
MIVSRRTPAAPADYPIIADHPIAAITGQQSELLSGR